MPPYFGLVWFVSLDLVYMITHKKLLVLYDLFLELLTSEGDTHSILAKCC